MLSNMERPTSVSSMSGRPAANAEIKRSAQGSRIGSTRALSASPPASPATRTMSDAAVARMTPPKTPVKAELQKWERHHEQGVMRTLASLRDSKKDDAKRAREAAIQLARKIPTEMLAKEWMSTHRMSLDSREFLVEQLLPTLILGVEKLLMEAGSLKLIEVAEPDPNFNPLNYLAQYLMRNNPKYSNFSEASPYIRSLREVGEQLKKQIFELEDNRLARIKNEAKRKREERERAALLKRQEKGRRTKLLNSQFLEWNLGVDGKISLALVQDALRTFAGMTEHLPDELKTAVEGLSKNLPQKDDTGKVLVLKEYVDHLMKHVEDLPAVAFEAFVVHLSRCALAYRAEQQSEQRRVTFSNLFASCDHSGVGVLDRHRVILLFEQFYDSQKDDVKVTLRNPRRWPVIEVDEADSDFSEEDEEQETAKDGDGDDVVPRRRRRGTFATEDQEAAAEAVTEAVASSSPRPGSGAERRAASAAPDGASPAAAASAEALEAAQRAGDVSGEAKPRDGELRAEAEQPAAAAAAESDGAAAAADSGEAATERTGAAAEEESTDELRADIDGASRQPDKQGDAKAEKPPPTRGGALSVSFARGTVLQRERTVLETRGTGSQSQMSAFDENTVNMSQFVQLSETFLGDYPALEVFQSLSRYIRDGYLETEEEKMARLMRAHKEAQTLKRRARVDVLFEKWDNDGSGFLDMDEVETVLTKYKDGLERQAILKAKLNFKKKNPDASDMKLTKHEFRELLTLVCEEIPGGDDTFDYFVDFLETSVERTYADRLRGEARKRWLQQIVTSSSTSGARMETVYRNVFQSLYKDAEMHGNGKIISANIAILERNTQHPGRGDAVLRYVAATADDANFLLGACLYRDMRGISFSAVDTGKPLHVPRVATHGNVQFWNAARPEEERDGSLVVVPLKDKKKRVFGVLGIDTMRDPQSKAIFITHEIQYYQGVAKAFSIAYHTVDSKRKTMRISESAISWICRRSPHVFEINVYLVEPDGKDEDYVLRRMMVASGELGEVKMFDNPSRLERKENLFRDYLFRCVDNSETVAADAYGERHSAFPIRGADGRAVAVIDISMGATKVLPKHERKETLRMLKLVQMAQRELTLEASEGQKQVVLEAEKGSEDTRVEVLFDRLMLMDLRRNVSKLDARAYAELKSYKDPPIVIRNIVKATLSLFYLGKAESGELDDWNNCKLLINSELNNKIAHFDPTAELSADFPAGRISELLDDIPHGVVAKHSSMPAECLYNWIFVCLSLIQHSKRMRASDHGEPTMKNMERTGMTPMHVIAPRKDDE